MSQILKELNRRCSHLLKVRGCPVCGTPEWKQLVIFDTQLKAIDKLARIKMAKVNRARCQLLYRLLKPSMVLLWKLNRIARVKRYKRYSINSDYYGVSTIANL